MENPVKEKMVLCYVKIICGLLVKIIYGHENGGN
jgi:hypothetical protein